MHHLINELRPHQARESIRVTMQSQKRQRFDTTARLNKQIERVNDIINSAISSITDYNISEINELNDSDVRFQSLTDNINNNNQNKDNNIRSDNNFDNFLSIIDKNYELDALMCNFVDEI